MNLEKIFSLAGGFERTRFSGNHMYLPAFAAIQADLQTRALLLVPALSRSLPVLPQPKASGWLL